MKLTKWIVPAEDPSARSHHSGSPLSLTSQSQKFQVTKRMVFEAGGFLLAMVFDDFGFLAWLLGSAYIDYSKDKFKDQETNRKLQ